jgi:hypothetical protein
MARRKFFIPVLFLLAALAALVFALKVKDEMADFEVNYQAAQRLRLGETLYRASDGHYQFKYLPFSAFLYLPLTALPPVAAKAVWFGIVFAAIVLIFLISFKLVGKEGKSAPLLLSLTFLIMGRYFLRELQLGQINALITLILMLMIWSSAGHPGRRKGSMAPGVLCGLATALKPYAAIFLPYFVLKRRWRSLAFGLGALFLAVLTPSLFYGLRGNFQVLGEWRSSLSASTPSLLDTQDNISIIGFLLKRTSNQSLSLLIYSIVLIILAGLVLFLVAKGKSCPRPAVLEGFLLLSLIPLISPLGWDYTMLSAAPATMLLLGNFGKFSLSGKLLLCCIWAVIALSLYDLLGRELYARFMSWSVITIDFLLLVGFLVFLRIKGHA